MFSKLYKPSNLPAHSCAVSRSGFKALCGLFHIEGQNWLKQRLHFQVHLSPCLYYFFSFIVAHFSSPPKIPHILHFLLESALCYKLSTQDILCREGQKKIRKILDLPKWIKPSLKQNYQPSQDSDIQIPRHHASPLKLINYSTWTIATEKSVCSRGKVLCSRTTCEIKKTTDLIHCRVLYFEFSRESPWLENSSPKGLAHTAVQKVGTA